MFSITAFGLSLPPNNSVSSPMSTPVASRVVTLAALAKSHFTSRERLVEVRDKSTALRQLHSKASASWANGIIIGTGWVKLSQASPSKPGALTDVFVCRESLVEA